MISIIICSTSKNINSIQKENIGKSIGVEYEIILIDNSQNKYNIFEAYNEGVKRAKYPYLCFCHEDICFRNKNWGVSLLNEFKDKNIGLIGVIGIKILPKYAFGWWAAGYDYYLGNVIANSNKSRMNPNCENHVLEDNKLEDAVACDGLFFAIPKDLFSLVFFDEKTYTGFHCYDLDICMQILSIGKKIKITRDILIEHYSTGNPTEVFSYNCYLFNRKWENFLPIYTNDVKESEVVAVQDNVIKSFFEDKPLAIRLRHMYSNKLFRLMFSGYKLIKRI